ncbi:zingipain-2-like [Neltuma alba]|uniref:zingipain-2-like n=1 Tax=Neltuma alba TaxID=207710 RepID=UPI0010A59CF8|nr:zingipain-2-like [Prosopis alba]
MRLTNNYYCPHAPNSLDWRDFGAVTDVKDQDKCDSCWALSTGAIEGINKIDNDALVSVSEKQPTSCDPYSNGCHKGSYVHDAFEYAIDNGGMPHRLISLIQLRMIPAITKRSVCNCSGLFNGSGCSEVAPYYINHVMLIVGYDSFGPGLDYWIVKNSWGKTWGEQGYIKIKRNIGHHLGVCNINCWGYYPAKKNVKLDSAT